MKLKHLGYYPADYPTLGLTGVDPGAEVDVADPGRARAMLTEGIFAPGDDESRQVLVTAVVDAATAEQQEEAADTVPAPDFTAALAEAQQALQAALEAAAAQLAAEPTETTTKARRAGKAGA